MEIREAKSGKGEIRSDVHVGGRSLYNIFCRMRPCMCMPKDGVCVFWEVPPVTGTNSV